MLQMHYASWLRTESAKVLKMGCVWLSHEGWLFVCFEVQSAILKRGLTILKPSGRLLYSTCSMSPIENEAVVAAALEKCLGY